MILIAGPCAIEDYVNLDKTLKEILKVIEGKNIEFFFKSSILKDNRTNPKNYRSAGTFFDGLKLLRDVGRINHVKICTDFHSETQIKQCAQFVDMIQIPAFLCRQTSLLEAAAKYASDKQVIQIKKMQSMPPNDIYMPVNIIRNINPDIRIMVVDRGTSFGYNQLIFDPRHIPIMKTHANEVLVDITHMNKYHVRWYWEELDFPGTLAKASIAAGADGLFIETHICPSNAMCDAQSQLTIEQFKNVVKYSL